MTRSQILSACAIDLAQFKARHGIEEWSLENTMLWQVAYFAGAKMVKEAQEAELRERLTQTLRSGT